MKLRFDPYSRANQYVIDASIFAFSFAAAFVIRFEGAPPWILTKQFLMWVPYLVGLRLAVNWKLGIYRFIWRYVSLPEAVAIARALLLPTGFFLGLRLLYPTRMIYGGGLRLPLTIITLEFLLSFIGMCGVRTLRRTLYERSQKGLSTHAQPVKRVLLYGAGRAGILLLRELKNQPGIQVVGFVDDDPGKIGKVISGCRVLGDRKAVEKLVWVSSVDEVVVSIARADRKALSQILAVCEAIPIPVKSIPSLQELFQGHVNISQLRQLKMEDLLGRESEVAEFGEEVRCVYSGKRILVTGAGGSIGSELVRQLVGLNPSSIAVLDKDENSTYELQQEMAVRFPEARIEPLIADVRHIKRLESLFSQFRPQIVFHAAAHKHVPLMEKHPCEAVLNNVHGTKVVLEACCRNYVERLIFISTDKAVNPTSIMGATKSMGEMLVRTQADGSFNSTCVRFGNVMGSRGSVIPLFQKQIADGGPLTITHPDVVRFFMTIPEAVQLVICAGSLPNHGEIFVMDMGNPRKVLDLAREMVALAGLDPERDIEFAVTGLRPGEKLVEELVASGEEVRPTKFEKLAMIVPRALDMNAFMEKVACLIEAAQENDEDGVYRLLSGMGIGFNPRPDLSSPPPAEPSTAPVSKRQLQEGHHPLARSSLVAKGLRYP